MGNRAVITDDLNGIGVYLHWNGGRDSVEAFLEYCKLRGFRSVNDDRSYAYARMVQIIGNFFGGGLSVGVDLCSNLDCDNYDNGVYLIDGWEIVGRKYFKGIEQREYKLAEMLKAIDEAQPEKERLGAYLDAQEIPVEQIKIGDTVYFIDWNGESKSGKVIGYGNGYVNGHDMTGKPYMDCYGYGGEDSKHNPNNYIMTATARVMRDE